MRLGALIGLGLAAWFEADGVMVIHARPHRMAELQELPDVSPELHVIQSEADILQSRSVIEPVHRLKFRRLPQLERANAGIGKLSRRASGCKAAHTGTCECSGTQLP